MYPRSSRPGLLLRLERRGSSLQRSRPGDRTPVFQLGSSPWGKPPFMFASTGMLIPEGVMSWVFHAKEKNNIKEHGGFANGKRKYQR